MNEDLVMAVIDDDAVNNLSLMKYFRAFGYNHVHWFNSIEQAYDMFSYGYNVDLLIISWDMEKNRDGSSMRATDFCKAIRMKGSETPVVFIARRSGRGTLAQQELEVLNKKAYEFGAVNVLIKPYDSDLVWAKLESVRSIVQNRKDILSRSTSLVLPQN